MGDNSGRILDLGCGDGLFMKSLKGNENWNVTGIELDQSSLRKAKKSKVYKEVFKGNVAKIRKLSKGKFDIIFSSQVLEHLKKDVAIRALDEWERLARKKIVVTTTTEFLEYDPIEKKQRDENPLQKHLSSFSPKELERKGYKVRGQGLRLIYGRGGIARTFPQFFSFFSFIAFLFSPLVYFYPQFGTYMIAWKEK